jgi:4-hydroxy-tetrahydrodipicolinate synthase
MSVFSGVFTALVTPFRDGVVDARAFQELVERQIAAGVTGLVPVGTTGESATLDDAEHWRVFDLCVEAARGRAIVAAGCGSNDTQAAIRHLRKAKAGGCDASLVVAPYYNRPSQEGLVRHFNALCDAVELPMIVYNIPGRTGVDIQPATFARIAQHPNVVALKDSAGDPSRTALHRQMAPPEIAYFAGDDNLALGFAAYGATGVVSVLSNLMPGELVRMQALLARSDFAAAQVINDRIDPLQRALFLEPNPGPVKFALAELGLCRADVRLPLVEPVDATKEAVRAAMLRAGGEAVGAAPAGAGA